MVRTYKRKTERAKWTKDSMSKAVDLVKNHSYSFSKAAEETGVPRNTIFREIKTGRTGYQQTRQVFSEEYEEKLVEYLLTSSRMCHGLSTVRACKLAYQCAVKNSLPTPPNWNRQEMAGLDWVKGFLKRHPEISIGKPEATSLGRATSFNKYTVDGFFTALEVLLRKHSFRTHRIYNMDETKLTTVHEPPKVIAGKQINQVGQVTSAERGILVTLVACVSAQGNFIPPTFIWPRKTSRCIDAYMRGKPDGSCALFHETGWMTSDNFLLWMHHFIQYTKPSKEDPVLLLLDKHATHITIAAIDLAKESGIVMLTFPSHTTHRLQPLDVSVYGPLKTFYNSACDEWQLSNAGKPISLYEIGALAGKALPRALKPENFLSGFRSTGIVPFDRNVFGEDAFLSSSVKDRPKPSPAEDSSFVLAQNATCSETPPEVVRPFPQAPPRKGQRKGPGNGALVVTDTPVKLALHGGKRKPPVASKKGLKFRKRQRIEIQETDSSSEEYLAVPLDDNSDDCLEYCDSTDSESTEPKICEGKYVLVRFTTKRTTRHFIGRVLTLDHDDGTAEVTFFKKIGEGQFVAPHIDDTSCVNVANVVLVLPEPTTSGGTERTCKKLSFATDLSAYTM